MNKSNQKFEYYNFDSWIIPTSMGEASGRGKKNWLQNKDDFSEVGLFKYPKSDETYEHVSEHLASQIGNIIGVLCADVQLGTYHGKYGSWSRLICNTNVNPNIAFVEGVSFLQIQYPQYNPNTLIDGNTGNYYSLDMIYKSLINNKLRMDFIRATVFDFLIGNSDRHQNNWGILINTESGLKFSLAPLYDNGSSLCSYVPEDSIEDYFSDSKRFTALYTTKSRSCIKINNKKNTRHEDVIRYILQKKYILVKDVLYMANALSSELCDLLNLYDDIISKQRKELIREFLTGKIQLIKAICEDYIDEKG